MGPPAAPESFAGSVGLTPAAAAAARLAAAAAAAGHLHPAAATAAMGDRDSMLFSGYGLSALSPPLQWGPGRLPIHLTGALPPQQPHGERSSICTGSTSTVSQHLYQPPL